MAEMNMAKAINLALHESMDRDERVIIMGEDVGMDEGVFRITEGLHAKFGDTRVIDTPLAESGIVGTAIGMAMYGMRPVCEIQFSGFDYYNYHQLESHAARFRNRTRGRITIPMVMRAPYGGGIRASLRKSRGSLRPYTRVEDGYSFWSAQRPSALARCHSGSGSGDLL